MPYSLTLLDDKITTTSGDITTQVALQYATKEDLTTTSGNLMLDLSRLDCGTFV